MVRYIDSKKMGRGRHGWLDSHFHFSFAEYRNPENMRFGVLRVLNDDVVQPGRGFDTHPHRDMEILSYVVDGELTHKDSVGNERTLMRGQVQYMSAGTGVLHSEYNHGQNPLRFLQIWILPDKNGYPPDDGDVRFAWEDRADTWLPLAAGFANAANPAPIKIHADINIHAATVSKNRSLSCEVAPTRQAYLVLIEGEALAGGIRMNMRDALEITGQNIDIAASGQSHVLIIEMARAT
jgi:redox-sensitive bicupin YhaK (pirin superfamily)